MDKVNKELIANMLEHSRLLLEKSIILAEDIKTKKGDDTRLRLNSGSEKERSEIIEGIIKESEQIRKNSGMVLTNIIQIQDLNK